MFDKLKSWFGQKPAAPDTQPGSREHAREVLAESWEAYRLARRDRPREHNQPHGYSGDAAMLGSHDLMHRRVRDLKRNTSQAKRIVDMLTNLVVGTGMQTYSWPFAPHEQFEIVTELETLLGGELGPRLSFAMESDDLFEEWAEDPKQFDAEGRLSWFEVQRMLMSESALVGTGLLVRTFVKDYSIVPLAWQMIEREQLDESQDRPASAGKNKIVGGREMDSNNRVVAYHIYLDHPHEFFGIRQSALMGASAPLSAGTQRARIPANRVIDLTLFDRPSSSGGVTRLDACGQSIWDRDSYTDSEIRSAALNAAFAFVAYIEDSEKSGALGFDDDLPDTDSYGNRSYKLGHSPVAATMGTNERLEMVKADRPNKDAPAFLKLLDRDIAASSGLSYYSLTGDYESTSFSSARGAKLDEDDTIRPLQKWFAIRVALRVRREFNAVAAAMGLFTTVTPAEFRRNQRTYQRFDAIGNGRDLLDPYKEGEARTTRLRTKLSTYKEECARVGKHWIRVLMQIAIEEKVSRMFGVTLDFSKAGTAASGQQQSTEQQAEQIADRVAMLLEDR